jgi:hypothetical protein
MVEPAALWRLFPQDIVTKELNSIVAIILLAFLPQRANPAAASVRAQLFSRIVVQHVGHVREPPCCNWCGALRRDGERQ